MRALANCPEPPQGGLLAQQRELPHVNTDVAKRKRSTTGAKLEMCLAGGKFAIIAVPGPVVAGKVVAGKASVVVELAEEGSISSNFWRLSCSHVEMSPGNIGIASEKLAALIMSSGDCMSLSNGENWHTSAAQGCKAHCDGRRVLRNDLYKNSTILERV